jgi:hypothetical protein
MGMAIDRLQSGDARELDGHARQHSLAVPQPSGRPGISWSDLGMALPRWAMAHAASTAFRHRQARSARQNAGPGPTQPLNRTGIQTEL